jgi:hypothetical protein
VTTNAFDGVRFEVVVRQNPQHRIRLFDFLNFEKHESSKPMEMRCLSTSRRNDCIIMQFIFCCLYYARSEILRRYRLYSEPEHDHDQAQQGHCLGSLKDQPKPPSVPRSMGKDTGTIVIARVCRRPFQIFLSCLVLQRFYSTKLTTNPAYLRVD